MEGVVKVPVLWFGVLIFIFELLIVDHFFALIGLAFIDTEMFSQVCWKLSVGRIQIIHTDLLPSQVCGRLWQRFQLGVQTCSHKLIDLLDLKYPLSYLCTPYFFCFRLVCIKFNGSLFIDTEIFPRVYLKIVSRNYKNRAYSFFSPTGLWKAWWRCRFCDLEC